MFSRNIKFFGHIDSQMHVVIRVLVVVATALLMFAVFATSARATTLDVVENQVTSSPFYETAPTLGNDGTSDFVVYTSRELLNTGFFDQGDIYYQRLDDGEAASGAAVPVTTGLTDDQLNDVSGDFIVYTSYDNILTETGRIMVYKISTGQRFVIGNSSIIMEARIAGNKVVWRWGGRHSAVIAMYDLSWLGTPQTAVPIAGSLPPTYEVEIGDRFVVWSERDGDYDLRAYDLASSTYLNITNTAAIDERYAGTSGAWIVWQAKNIGSSTSSIEAFNVDTGERRVIADGGGRNRLPNINGDLISWEGDAEGNFNVYLHSLSMRETWKVTSSSGDQYLNDVFDRGLIGLNTHEAFISYVDMTSGNAEIFVSKARIPGVLTGKIAFDSDRDGDYEIYMMDAGGGNQIKLTNNLGRDYDPDISSDGSKIVYSSSGNDPGGRVSIYTMNSDGTNKTRLTDEPTAFFERSPAFSPDGSKIIFQTDRDGYRDVQIYIMDADGANQTRLTGTNVASINWYPDFSPDGTKIVFGSSRDWVGSGSPEANNLYTMNVDGTNKTKLTNNTSGPALPLFPEFSPDGTKIVYTKRVDYTSTSKIYSINVDGTNERQLYSSLSGHSYWPSFSSDGTKITFTFASAGNFDIYIMNADGSNQTRITNDAAVDGQSSWAMNSLAGAGVAPVTVEPGYDVNVTFSDIIDPGNTFVTADPTDSVPPAGFAFLGNQYNISTDANYTSPVTITIPYDEGLVTGNEADLQLWHWDGSDWIDVTVLVDTVNNTITGQTNSLSPFILGEPLLPASIEVDPGTLNKRSKGQYITAHIELPDGTVSDIDVSTILLNGSIWAEPSPIEIGDYDRDGEADITIKFNRDAVQLLVTPGDAVELIVSGSLFGGSSFKGMDAVKVINKGKDHIDHGDPSSVEY